MSGYPLRGRHGDTVRTLGRRVVDGHYQPDDTLDLDALVAELGVSRTVLREAFKVLAAKGLIDARPTRGTYVLPRSAWNLLDPDLLDWHTEAGYGGRYLEELTELRMLTEPSIAALASRRCTERELAEMASALSDMRSVGLDRAAFVAADIRFHRAMLAASRNELLRQIGPVVEATLRAGTDELDPGSFGAMVSSHAALFEQVCGGDGPAATATMRVLVQAEGDCRCWDHTVHALPA